MTGQRTALVPRLGEHQKARMRLPLLTLLAVVFPPIAGVRTTAVWIAYGVFVILYSLWCLRLITHYATDRRLGYLLCLTDTAILLPLMVWSAAAGVQVLLVLVCAAGLAITHMADRAVQGKRRHARSGLGSLDQGPARTAYEHAGLETSLERAVRQRLGLFTTTGARFALVVLRIVRFEETAAYYGPPAADRLQTAVSRRGLRLLGPDAQHFPLPGGRVAFLFETDSGRHRQVSDGDAGLTWSDPYDVEGLAMSVGRKACEHLIDGHRVECVVGWASAPADGLNADDLMYVAETGAQSTAAFRRVAGGQVTVPERARVAAG
jgi:GGDEF domain-containing protein